MRLFEIFMRTQRRAVRGVLAFTHLLVGAAIAGGFFPLCARLLPKRAERVRRSLVKWWARSLCRLLGLKIRIDGQIHDDGTLFVANHVSWLDIPCLLSITDAAFVSKDDVARWPFIGSMAARVGTIFLARGNRDATANAADAMTWRLASRHSVLIFPEGTTTDGTSVRAFHGRLFQAAIRTHALVQPIAIRYGGAELSRVAPFIDEDNLLSHFWKLIGEDQVTVRIQFCDVIAPNLDRRALATEARVRVCAALDLIPTAVGDRRVEDNML